MGLVGSVRLLSPQPQTAFLDQKVYLAHFPVDAGMKGRREEKGLV